MIWSMKWKLPVSHSSHSPSSLDSDEDMSDEEMMEVMEMS